MIDIGEWLVYGDGRCERLYYIYIYICTHIYKKNTNIQICAHMWRHESVLGLMEVNSYSINNISIIVMNNY